MNIRNLLLQQELKSSKFAADLLTLMGGGKLVSRRASRFLKCNKIYQLESDQVCSMGGACTATLSDRTHQRSCVGSAAARQVIRWVRASADFTARWGTTSTVGRTLISVEQLLV